MPVFGARVPVIQRKEDPADENNRRNQNEVGLKPGRPEERIAPKSRQRTGRHTEAQQLCGLFVGLRERESGMPATGPDDRERTQRPPGRKGR